MTTTTLSPNATLIQRLHALFNQGRLAECELLVTDDIVVDFAALGARFEGKKQFVDFMTGFQTAFPDMVIEGVTYRDTQDGALVECRWRGTHRGPLVTPAGTIPPTNKTVEGGRFVEIFRIEDGKITDFVNYQDVGTWLRQLGVA